MDEGLAPYVPNFQYQIYDISHCSDDKIRGKIITRLTLGRVAVSPNLLILFML